MCEPISATTALTYTSLAFTAGSTILNAVGQSQAGKAEAAQARYNAAVQRNNEIISNQLAEDSRQRGEIAEKQHRLQISQLKGRQKAVLAASGIEVDSGSALDVLSDTAEIGELEALTIRNNAEREAQGFETQAMNFGASAQNNLLAADSAESAGRTAAFGTLLGGAGSVAGKWYNFRKGF